MSYPPRPLVRQVTVPLSAVRLENRHAPAPQLLVALLRRDHPQLRLFVTLHPPVVASAEQSAAYVLVGRHLSWVGSVACSCGNVDPSSATIACLELDPAGPDEIRTVRNLDAVLYTVLERVVRGPSRVSQSRARRRSYKQVCPVCALKGRTEPIRFSRWWKRERARGQLSPVRCARCGLCLRLTPAELDRLISQGIPLDAIWRIRDGQLVHLNADGQPDQWLPLPPIKS